MSDATPISPARQAAAVHWKEADRIWKTVIESAQLYNKYHTDDFYQAWEAAIALHKAECDKAKAIDPDWRETAAEDYPE